MKNYTAQSCLELCGCPIPHAQKPPLSASRERCLRPWGCAGWRRNRGSNGSFAGWIYFLWNAILTMLLFPAGGRKQDVKLFDSLLDIKDVTGRNWGGKMSIILRSAWGCRLRWFWVNVSALSNYSGPDTDGEELRIGYYNGMVRKFPYCLGDIHF